MKRLLALLLFTATSGIAAAQQPAPVDPASLNAICSNFLAQGAGSVSGDRTKLCACLVRETSAKLTLPEMTAYAEATLANRPPPDAIQQKMVAIANQCLREAQ